MPAHNKEVLLHHSKASFHGVHVIKMWSSTCEQVARTTFKMPV